MRVLYLDTSFLSQFCNLESGKLKTTTEIKMWGDLLARLRQGVRKGALVCPASQFQTQEASLAPALFPQFSNIQLELSKGLFFKHWEDILVHQAANQVLIYMKRAQDINLGWKPFSKQIPPVIPPEATTKSKREIEEFAKRKQEEDASGRSFAEQYSAQKANLLRETFLLPVCQIKGIPTYDKPSGSFQKIFFTSLLANLMVEADIPLDELEETIAFFGTDLVDKIPFIHIFCSLFASVSLTRNYKIGDWLDIAPMACVIPYCSIVTTDKNMKSRIVDQLDFFNKEYKADIYTPSPNDLPAFTETLDQYC